MVAYCLPPLGGLYNKPALATGIGTTGRKYTGGSCRMGNRDADGFALGGVCNLSRRTALHVTYGLSSTSGGWCLWGMLMNKLLVIDTDEVPQRDRFDVWRDAFSNFQDMVVEPASQIDFSASCRNLAVRDTMFGVYKTPARRIFRTSEHRSRHDIDHLVVRVALSCDISGRQRDRDYHLSPGGIGISTFAYGYEEVHTAGTYAVAILPRSSLPDFADDGSPRLLGGVRAALLRDVLISLTSSLAEATHEDLLIFEDVFRRVLESILQNKDGPAVADDLRLKRVDEILRSEMGSSRLTAARVCELAGVSRATLYRLFRERGGVEKHLTALRLDAIRKDLKEPALSTCSISRIAESRGMHNASAFSRAFQRRFGCTPSDVRHGASVRRAGTRESDLGVADAPGSFIRLLRART